jgi:hypothetical protein
MSGYRLPVPGSASRGAELSVRFDGRALQAHGGETLAAALLAAGVRVVGRSFKYHRPRGIYGFDLDDPNGLVTCGDDPLALATGVATTTVCALPGNLELFFRTPAEVTPTAVDIRGSDGRILVRFSL